MPTKKHLQVVAGLIEHDGRFLVAQRADDDHYGGLWEFPGGAIEAGESAHQALIRELQEELGVDVQVQELLLVYDDEAEHLKITVSLYRCRILRGVAWPKECQDVRWMPFSQIGDLALAPADRAAYEQLVNSS